MELDIFLYRQHVAAPAQQGSSEQYQPVCELGCDFSLIAWMEMHVGEVENSNCLELSREHIQQIIHCLDCALAKFTEGNEENQPLLRRMQYIFSLRDRLKKLLSDFDFEHEYLWFYASW